MDSETRVSGTHSTTNIGGSSSPQPSTLITVPRLLVNLTGGPLSYRYRFQEIHLHFGLHDQFGSEHSVQGHFFPAEVRSKDCDRKFKLANKFKLILAASNIRLQFPIVSKLHGRPKKSPWINGSIDSSSGN